VGGEHLGLVLLDRGASIILGPGPVKVDHAVGSVKGTLGGGDHGAATCTWGLYFSNFERGAGLGAADRVASSDSEPVLIDASGPRNGVLVGFRIFDLSPVRRVGTARVTLAHI